ncbi:MAG: hypothetical protein ACJAUV_001983 [Flavobacteriales bacterium]|jgi:hypothetical protein
MTKEWTDRLQELLQQELNIETDAIFKPIAAAFDEALQADKKEKLAIFLAEEEDRTDNDFSFKASDEMLAIQTLIASYRAKKKAIREEKAKQERENYIAKKAIVEKIAKITQDQENIGKAFGEFKTLQEKWTNTGRVPGDQHKNITADYYKAVEDFYYNISLYKDLQEYDFKKNYTQKIAVVAQIKELVALTSIKELDANAKDLQQQWYDLGPVPKEHFETLKIEFKLALDAAYAKIKELKAIQEKEQVVNLEKKQALLEKIKEVVAFSNKDAKQWDKSTANLKVLQDEWKTIGFGPKAENELIWQELRTLCDVFFDNKKGFFAEHRADQNKIKELKEKLIEDAKKWQESTDWRTATDKFLKLQENWKKAGAASQRDENKLWKEFRTTCDQFFNHKKAHFESQDAEQVENLAKKEAVIADLTFFKLSKDKNADLQSIKDFMNTWSTIGHIPKKKLDQVNGAYRAKIDELFSALDIDAATLEKEKFEAKIKGWYQEDNGDTFIAKEQMFIRKKIDELITVKAQYENNMAFISTANAEKNPLLKGAMKELEQTNSQIELQKEKLKIIRTLKPKAESNA